MRVPRRAHAAVAACAATAIVAAVVQAVPASADTQPKPPDKQSASKVPPVKVEEPGKKLGQGWNTTKDRAFTSAADTKGLQILVADSSKAYEWKTAAVLAEPGVPADSWIGNECVMDADHVAAVYAPRTFTNKPDLMQGGAFAAIVNTTTGKVVKLAFTASLAYFDPSCNTVTHTAAFTAFRYMNDPDKTRTRVVTVDTSGKTTASYATSGEVTSAVPVQGGVVAGRGNQLVRIGQGGRVTPLATGDTTPFDIRPTARGNVAYVERSGKDTARAKLFRGSGKPSVLAVGKLGDIDLRQGGQGRVFLTGKPSSRPDPAADVTRLDVPADTDVSTLGRLAVNPVITPGVRHGLARIKDAGKGFDAAEATAAVTPQKTVGAPDTVDPVQPVTVTSTAAVTGKAIEQAVPDSGSGMGNASLSPALTSGSAPTAKAAAGVSHDPVDTDRWCSVPRNDVKSLALQPTPNQVEWAVDMAVRNELRSGRVKQGDWRNQLGLGTVDPQGLFPRPDLIGGGRIPANVLLGVMAQESNLWQAEPGSIPGQMGNPLASYAGFYGHKGSDPADYWKIHWEDSDCGYGVGQVTDGMRIAGHAKEGEKLLDPDVQRAVALDYTVNVAASLYILADKWNELHQVGQTVTINNDDPSRVENWFAALWNYNLGFNPRSDEGKNGNWGLGWYNNPANPIYPPDRDPFMDMTADPLNWPWDAAHPQYWPYEEKVMGWSAWSIDTGYSYATSGRQDWPGESGYATAGFRPAWWTNDAQRRDVKPPLDTFCNTHNGCDTANPPDCPDADCYTQYWWHEPNATWKAKCLTCGNENIKYESLVSEPGRGTRLKNGEPRCDNQGLPMTALVVESFPGNTNSYGPCGETVKNWGHFSFDFQPDADGRYEAKSDLYQIGGGNEGHFWYAHTRDAAHLGGENGPMTIKGTWTLDDSLTWARVMVHLPDTGAHTRQASYKVGGSDSTSPKRVVVQRANRWVSLGAFHFTGTPTVTLTNATEDGTADEDMAWDAVAFQPLTGKPRTVEVAMGDSYSSGEGASENGGDDYFPETDYAGNGDSTDKCHRSKYAWSRRAVLPGETSTTAELEESWWSGVDYHFIACSGARHYNILNRSQSGELPQIEQGYLDQNTTLIPLSVGGNDMGFTDIFNTCLTSLDGACTGETIDARNPDTGDKTGVATPPLEDWAPVWAHETVRPRLVKTLAAIHAAAPNAKIVLMGYPRLLEHIGSCLMGLSMEEANWINGVADMLADEMRGAVADAGTYAVFSDPRDEFDGEAICGDPETINGLVMTGHSKADNDPPKPSMKSMHPKVSGTVHYAKAFEKTLGG
ncbi:SGNH/GDSL hydrolase family protein [Streptomyces sp. NPDC048567]|uniref:SGNH/GDSL hydrolase family protein n=1 Tax=Streptomyces sp. NPDC048567 TaxID=3365570 RepID=UPI003716C27D